MVKTKKHKTGITTHGFSVLKKQFKNKNCSDDIVYMARTTHDIYISGKHIVIKLPFHAGFNALNKIAGITDDCNCIVLDEYQCIMNFEHTDKDLIKSYTKTANNIVKIWEQCTETATNMVGVTQYTITKNYNNFQLLAIEGLEKEHNTPCFVSEKYLNMVEYKDCLIRGSTMFNALHLNNMSTEMEAAIMPYLLYKNMGVNEREIIDAIVKL